VPAIHPSLSPSARRAKVHQSAIREAYLPSSHLIDHNRHQLVFTTRSAPMMDFLILLALQRVWALGLAGPEAGTYDFAKLTECVDVEELAFW
jgi:hypothetical protein